MELNFKNYIINNEIFINEKEWSLLKNNYNQNYLIQEISDAIAKFDINLPYRKITYEDMVNDYIKLKELDTESLIKNGQWISKFNYSYENLNKYIDLNNSGSKASDYFHQIERWKCDATGYPSPQKTWENEKFRLTLFKALFSLKLTEINPDKLRNCISLRKYIASQFRPSTAKAIYDYFKAESVLDFSMGWGDRLLAAHSSKYVKNYVGFDPNINLHSGYKNQINEYNKINDNNKTFKFYENCAEDETIILNDKFDLIFTSPPYFDKEKYNQSSIQSYKKYVNFDDWMKSFLFKTINIRISNLNLGGHLVINISDIYSRKKRYEICDAMNNFIASNNNMEYIGAIGFRMPKRPQSMSSDTIGIYGEPIYIWKKIN